VQLAYALNTEFRCRHERERDHACINVLREIEYTRLPSRGLIPFAQAMPDQYKVLGDPVTAYRAFYIGEKRGLPPGSGVTYRNGTGAA